jgi:hypothetical protein
VQEKPVRNHSSCVSIVGDLLIGLAVICCSACDSDSRSNLARNLPRAETARRAIEGALQAWQKTPLMERTTTTIRPVMFVDQQQPQGQQLREYHILGETPGYEAEGYRRFLVRLFLAEPEDTVVATYYVFGQDPMWVYRSEDFDMIMHMDKSMMPTPPAHPAIGEDLAGPGDRPGDLPAYQHHPRSSTAETSAQTNHPDDGL